MSFLTSLFTDFKFRASMFIFGNILVLAVLILTDPDMGYVGQLPFGASTLNLIISLSKMTLFVSVLYACLWTILEEAGFNAKLSNLFSKATDSESGAGLALVAVALFAIAIAIILAAVIH